jgi:hypothetical protein
MSLRSAGRSIVKYRRLLRCQLGYWRDLAILTGLALCGSNVRRSQAKLRWAIWLCEIDFVGVQGLLNDLLW